MVHIGSESFRRRQEERRRTRIWSRAGLNGPRALRTPAGSKAGCRTWPAGRAGRAAAGACWKTGGSGRAACSCHWPIAGWGATTGASAGCASAGGGVKHWAWLVSGDRGSVAIHRQQWTQGRQWVRRNTPKSTGSHWGRGRAWSPPCRWMARRRAGGGRGGGRAPAGSWEGGMGRGLPRAKREACQRSSPHLPPASTARAPSRAPAP
jgi:hypothetical protein